jgi:hypothetical protein
VSISADCKFSTPNCKFQFLRAGICAKTVEAGPLPVLPLEGTDLKAFVKMDELLPQATRP